MGLVYFIDEGGYEYMIEKAMNESYFKVEYIKGFESI